MLRYSVLLMAFAASWAGLAASLQAAEHVQTEVLASATQVKPGQTFTVGVRFTIDPKWHIYWHNPGDSGLATDIMFELPKGWTVSELRWPLPIRFIQPGDIAGYGYENQVLLTAKVTVPADAQTGTTHELTLTPNWLVCKDICIPGEATHRLSVQIADDTTPANEELFKQHQTTLPGNVHLTTTTTKDGKSHRVELTFKQTVTELAVLPHTNDAMTFENLTIKATGGKSAVLTYDVGPGFGADPVKWPATFLVTWIDADGNRAGQTVVVD